MDAKLVGALVDSVPEILLGIFLILLRARVVGKTPGKDVKFDQFMKKNDYLLKVGGPLIILIGIIMLFSHF